MLNKKSHINYIDSQAGVTLMLSVLILASITAVAFSLASIVFIEIRASGDSARTEPALYAAFGVTEEALYQYKRAIDPAVTGENFDIPTCAPSVRDVCLLNGVTLSMPGTQPFVYDDVPRIEYVAGGNIKTIPLYLAGNFNKEYGKITLQAIPIGSTANMSVYLKKTDINGDQTSPVPGSQLTLTEQAGTLTYNTFDITGQYDLILDNSANSSDMRLTINSFGPDGTTSKGLPFLGQVTLKIMADYLGLTRVYKVSIPVP